MGDYIVTGARRGIGREVALALAEKGHGVWALSRTPLDPSEWPAGIRLRAVDPVRLGDWLALVEELQASNRTVAGVINSAGYLVRKPLENLTPADFEESFAANATAPALAVQALMPLFSPDVHVVTLSSMGGFQGSVKFPGMAAYSSSKAAAVCLTEVLQTEFNDRGWSFNVLCLGAVQTEMLAEAFPGFEAPVSAEEMGRYVADFVCTGHRFFRGKVLPVSSTTP